MYSTDAPTSPEQFLREFAEEIVNAKNFVERAKLIKGYAKLLKLREQGARIDTLWEEHHIADRPGLKEWAKKRAESLTRELDNDH